MLEMCYVIPWARMFFWRLGHPFLSCFVYGVYNFTCVVSTNPGVKRNMFVSACGLLTSRYVREPLQNLHNSRRPRTP